MSSFLGSVWFACFTFVVGYLIAHALPITWIASKFGKNK